MPKKNIQGIAFDDRNLPINPMSKERMDDLEKKFAPLVEELKHKIKEEQLRKIELHSSRRF